MSMVSIRKAVVGYTIISLISGIIGLFIAEHKIAKIEKEKAMATQKLREYYDSEIEKLNKKNREEAEKYEKTIANIRSRAVRVSIPKESVSITCPANGEARAELNPEAVERILSVGRDGDKAIRNLNTCIDMYNKAKENM